ncbi:hypothetical protein HMSSN036_26610 [Paenibacillus macerans]|nr:hypothetical protein [Paenibacillus macerans]GIP11397.1 hypothetical protein J1TS5_35670 [Paenibacillus macerans]GJM70445.1 hypothetical protein HMSSN036_26610 [Paenibacillus macerans]
MEDLKSQLLWESSNPVDTITNFAKKEAEAGRNVEINPHALRYDTYELSSKIKEEMLQRAIDSLR